MPTARKEFTCNFRRPVHGWKGGFSIKRSVTRGAAPYGPRGYSLRSWESYEGHGGKGVEGTRAKGRRRRPYTKRGRNGLCQSETLGILNFHLDSSGQLSPSVGATTSIHDYRVDAQWTKKNSVRFVRASGWTRTIRNLARWRPMGINNATRPMIFSVFAATTTRASGRASERRTNGRTTDLSTDRQTRQPGFHAVARKSRQRVTLKNRLRRVINFQRFSLHSPYRACRYSRWPMEPPRPGVFSGLGLFTRPIGMATPSSLQLRNGSATVCRRN